MGIGLLKEVLSVSIGNLINKCGEKYSPYRNKLVNHLPMMQMALYKMTGNLRRVEKLTKTKTNKPKWDPVRQEYPKCKSIEDCLGKREMYESVLDILQNEIREDNIDEYVSDILNRYSLGISSGLFHTLIRLYYAIEGYGIERNLIDEVRRATSYYITAYRQADVFSRKIEGKDIIEEMEGLIHNQKIHALIQDKTTIGKKMRVLYTSPQYLKAGFVIDGNKDEKVEALLSMLLPIYINTGNIIILHCITGLQALLGLEKYYNDFDSTLDILTTTIITHLMTIGELDFHLKERDRVDFSWEYIMSLGSESQDSHNIKFAYSCHEISKNYPVKNLKRATLKRIDTI